MELCIVFGVKNTQPLENLYNYVFFYYLHGQVILGMYLESCCFKIHENIFNLWYDPQIYSFASLFFLVFLWFLSIVWRGGQKYISRQAQRVTGFEHLFFMECWSVSPAAISYIAHHTFLKSSEYIQKWWAWAERICYVGVIYSRSLHYKGFRTYKKNRNYMWVSE